jgi:hypothetical protein
VSHHGSPIAELNWTEALNASILTFRAAPTLAFQATIIPPLAPKAGREIKLLLNLTPNIERMVRREQDDILDSWIQTTSIFREQTKFLTELWRAEEFSPLTFQNRRRAGSIRTTINRPKN